MKLKRTLSDFHQVFSLNCVEVTKLANTAGMLFLQAKCPTPSSEITLMSSAAKILENSKIDKANKSSQLVT